VRTKKTEADHEQDADHETDRHAGSGIEGLLPLLLPDDYRHPEHQEKLRCAKMSLHGLMVAQFSTGEKSRIETRNVLNGPAHRTLGILLIVILVLCPGSHSSQGHVGS